MARKAGGCTPGAFGAQSVVVNHSLGPALPNKLKSSPPTSAPTCSEQLPHIFPHRRMQAKQSLTGMLHPQIPRGRKARHNISPALLLPASRPPQQSIIHLSDISPANLAKQKCFFFNTSRNRELWGEKLMIKSPLVFAVVIYSQEWRGCCHVNQMGHNKGC